MGGIQHFAGGIEGLSGVVPRPRCLSIMMTSKPRKFHALSFVHVRIREAAGFRAFVGPDTNLTNAEVDLRLDQVPTVVNLPSGVSQRKQHPVLQQTIGASGSVAVVEQGQAGVKEAGAEDALRVQHNNVNNNILIIFFLTTKFCID